MSISDTNKAQRYASIAEVAAAQAKLYADKLENAPDYAEQAKQYSEQAQSSSESAASSASSASSAEISSAQNAAEAAEAALNAESAAQAVFDGSVHAPQGESLSSLPASSDREDTFVVFGADGDVSVKPLSDIVALDSSGKIPVSMLPAIAITDTFVVNSEAAMLALVAETGDVAKRTDLGYSFILSADPATTLSNWVQLTDDVLSQLALSSGASEVGALDSDGNEVTVQEGLNSKVNTVDISIPGYSGVNIVDKTTNRLSALTGNVIRFCTWNIQNGYIIFGYYDDPDGGNAARFNKDEDSPLYISEINEHLLRMGIDIVGFQEVIHRWDAPIALRALYPYVDAAEGRTDLDANGVTINRVYSNAVMSMKTITSHSNTVLAPRVGSTDGNSMVKTIINWNGTIISSYNVHLAASDDATRLAQLDTVAGILNADTNTHIVLTGDFNLHLDSQFSALTNIGFSMVNNENGPNTYNGSQGWVWHMDRIFYKGFSSEGSWAVDEETPRELGDHKPVWVDLTI